MNGARTKSECVSRIRGHSVDGTNASATYIVSNGLAEVDPLPAFADVTGVGGHVGLIENVCHGRYGSSFAKYSMR